jgi:hypothetical protein
MNKRKIFKFQTELKRTEVSLKQAEEYKRVDMVHFQNEPIRFDNGYSLSIQCSSGMYCHPRISQEDPMLYDEYEVGVLYIDGDVNLEDFFLSIGHRHVEDTWLAAYVPSEKVQMIYDYVKEIRTKYTPRPKKIGDLFNNDSF